MFWKAWIACSAVSGLVTSVVAFVLYTLEDLKKYGVDEEFVFDDQDDGSDNAGWQFMEVLMYCGLALTVLSLVVANLCHIGLETPQ